MRPASPTRSGFGPRSGWALLKFRRELKGQAKPCQVPRTRCFARAWNDRSSIRDQPKRGRDDATCVATHLAKGICHLGTCTIFQVGLCPDGVEWQHLRWAEPTSWEKPQPRQQSRVAVTSYSHELQSRVTATIADTRADERTRTKPPPIISMMLAHLDDSQPRQPTRHPPPLLHTVLQAAVGQGGSGLACLSGLAALGERDDSSREIHHGLPHTASPSTRPLPRNQSARPHHTHHPHQGPSSRQAPVGKGRKETHELAREVGRPSPSASTAPSMHSLHAFSPCNQRTAHERRAYRPPDSTPVPPTYPRPELDSPRGGRSGTASSTPARRGTISRSHGRPRRTGGR